jgi:hypothetical protein
MSIEEIADGTIARAHGSPPHLSLLEGIPSISPVGWIVTFRRQVGHGFRVLNVMTSLAFV